ncbi:MAG TPA: hypothetical protein VJ861_06250 [Treponemataceae bacterium]|nr:hypothetical protein [Treponemataceae bacterium]
MFRRICILSCSVFLVCSCMSSPKQNTVDFSLARYGAGSMDDDSPNPSKAVPMAGLAKTKEEELLSRASLYEADLDTALKSNDFLGALQSVDSLYFLLSQSPSSSIPAGRLQSARNKIILALESISFEAVSIPSETRAEKPFNKEFGIRVSFFNGEESLPLSNFACTIFSPEKGPDGIMTVHVENAMTDSRGICEFAPPVPTFAYKGTVVIASSLDSRDPFVSSHIDVLKKSGRLGTGFPYRVTTNARAIPTTISLLDFDKNGKAIVSSNPSSTALLMPLVKNGFSRIGMAEFPDQIASGNEDLVIKAAKAQFGSAVTRFIFGTNRIEILEQDDEGMWVCQMKASIVVRNLSDGTSIFRTEVIHTEKAKTQAAAILATRTKLCGELLVTELLYNL